MAAKHDGKRARENMWVTHQNLAKAKGGRPLYMPKPPKTGVVAVARAKATAPKAKESAHVDGVASESVPATQDTQE